MIDIAKSVNAAVGLLDSKPYGVVLLDMALPTFNESNQVNSGGRQQNFGGREILTYMWELEIDVPVVLITQFRDFIDKNNVVDLPTIDEGLRKDFPNLYRGYAYFVDNSDSWKSELNCLIQRGER